MPLKRVFFLIERRVRVLIQSVHPKIKEKKSNKKTIQKRYVSLIGGSNG